MARRCEYSLMGSSIMIVERHPKVVNIDYLSHRISLFLTVKNF